MALRDAFLSLQAGDVLFDQTAGKDDKFVVVRFAGPFAVLASVCDCGKHPDDFLQQPFVWSDSAAALVDPTGKVAPFWGENMAVERAAGLRLLELSWVKEVPIEGDYQLLSEGEASQMLHDQPSLMAKFHYASTMSSYRAAMMQLLADLGVQLTPKQASLFFEVLEKQSILSQVELLMEGEAVIGALNSFYGFGQPSSH